MSVVYANDLETTDDLHETTVKIERALLGAVLTVGLIPKVTPRPEDFALEAHRVTWTAVLAIAARGEGPEIIPVTWELYKTGRLQAAGGEAYVAGHMVSTDCYDLGIYARMVREAAVLRKRKTWAE